MAKLAALALQMLWLLVGLTALPADSEQQPDYKLPSWFSFELYKRFHGKQYARDADNELHKRIYLRAALQVFEKRALFRAGRASSLVSLNELSDLSSAELEALRKRRRRVEVAPAGSAECCSYDEVYRRVIELLSTSDPGLARAYLDELEQRPLVEPASPQAHPSETAGFAAPQGAGPPDADTPKAELSRIVARQVDSQLSPATPLGRRLADQMSALVGEPVRVRALPAL